MFGNLASYIFGSGGGQEEGPNEPLAAPNQPLVISSASTAAAKQEPMAAAAAAVAQKPPPAANSSDEEADWVMVGGAPDRSAATLGSLNAPPPPQQMGSTGSSANQSDDEEMEDEFVQVNEGPNAPPPPARVNLSRTARRLANANAFGGLAPASDAAQLKSARAGQLQAVAASKKVSTTAKSAEKKNKAVKQRGKKETQKSFASRANLPLKSSGVKRHLKQC